MGKPRVCIVSPALAAANNGNWHTASRWQRFLSPLAEVQIVLAWQAEPVDAMIALHARRSADSIARFHAAHPRRPLALVLTGTDLYRDLGINHSARHSLQCASHLVVLQERALQSLDAVARAKARVIVQSATRLIRHDKAKGSFDFVAVGHLREEKDPLTLMRAAARLPAPLRVLHIGNPLDRLLADAARRCMAECPHYHWLGGLPANVTRRWMARSRALVHMSRIEGGAHAVIEAVRSRVPVLASRIDGNVGLLGERYDGYFALGVVDELVSLMQRFAADAAFAAHLAQQCAQREPGFTPEAEARQVRALLADLLAVSPAELMPQ